MHGLGAGAKTDVSCVAAVLPAHGVAPKASSITVWLAGRRGDELPCSASFACMLHGCHRAWLTLAAALPADGIWRHGSGSGGRLVVTAAKR